MNDIVAKLNYWARRLGGPMLAGFALAGAALVFYAVIGLPTDRRLQALEQEASHLRAGADQRRPVWMPEDPGTALRSFYRVLPPENAIPDLMEKIFDAAYENNVALEGGQFKLTREDHAAFSQYLVVLPATGSYADIRKFMNRVLEQNPAAALDGIGFSREDVKSSEVGARVRFTLYLRASGK